MEKLVTGTAVFLAVLCGQPELLAIFCLYLFVTIFLAAAAATLLRSPRPA
jgi:hypothetical protein